jgi:PAS domain S-box-containing protein
MSRLDPSPQSISTDRATEPLRDAQRGLWIRALAAARAVPCRISVDDLSIEAIDPSIETVTSIPVEAWREPRFWDNVVHADDRAALSEARQAGRSGREVLDLSLRIASGDRQLQLRICGALTNTVDGSYPVYDSFLVVDPAPLIDQNRDLLERLAVATDAGVVSLWEMDVARMTIESDPLLAGLIGFEPGELMTHDQWTARIHPDDRERTDAFEREMMADGEAYATRALPVIGFRIVHRDGSSRWVENRVRVRYDDAGHPVRVVGAVNDVTDRVRHRESRDAAAELSRAVLASFPGHVAVLDDHGRVIAANDGWRGLSHDAGCECVSPTAVGENHLEACRAGAERGHEQARGILVAIERALRAETTRERLEYTCTGSAARSFVVLVEALKAPWRGVIVAYLDVSERARGERDLQQARHALMRAAQLALAGELVGGITHDLRQPLTALAMDLTVANHMLHRSSPIVREAVQAIEDASAEQRRLTESLRVLEDLVRRREPRRAPLALGALATEVVRLVRTVASARRVELDLRVAQTLLPISADENLVREAVLSLVLDAVETSVPADDGRTVVAIEITQPDNEVVELCVRYARRIDADIDPHWAISVARSVAEAHMGALSTRVDPTGEVSIRTRWPMRADYAESSM